MMSELEYRQCPVCDAEDYNLEYSQTFQNIVGIPFDRFEQRVVICKDCGMIYVNPYLTDMDLEKYYAFMSSYEYSKETFEYAIPHKNRSLQQSNYILSQLAKRGSVLDVGCSIGYTLNLFKKDGFQKVLGIDPSPKCSQIAEEDFGIKVKTGFFDKKMVEGQKFDLVILSHVAEHLKHPETFLKDVKEVMTDGGALFVEIPSIDLFDERDLFQFSFEHINYFNLNSLTNLMHQAGFKLFDSILFENGPSIAPFYPTLGSLWQKDDNTKAMPITNLYKKNKATLQRYIDLIKSHRNSLNQKIDKIISKHKKIGIWCAGTLTAQLLAQTNLLKGNITVIFDNDPKKNGQTMSDIPIYKPDITPAYFEGKIDAIVIGSWSSQNEIYDAISFLESAGITVYKLFD
jgi:SAM-dependent methyltransferase